MATLTENVARVTSALADIKNAIINKGITPTGKCETFADAISSIPSGGGGTDVSDTTAIPSKVSENCAFYNSSGTKVYGTLREFTYDTGPYEYGPYGSEHAPQTPAQKYDKVLEDGLRSLKLGINSGGSTPHGGPREGVLFRMGGSIAFPVAPNSILSEDNVFPKHVLDGIMFSNANKFGNVGTMPNNGAISETLDANTTSYTVAEGYHNGSGTVSISTQTKTVTPSDSQQTVTPDAGKLLSSVIVEASSSTLVKMGTFTSNLNGATIDCGFVPKQVFVCVNLGTTAYSQLDMYKEGSYSGARGASVNSGGTIGTATITVSGNTFTHKAFNSNYAKKTSYYIAIG